MTFFRAITVSIFAVCAVVVAVAQTDTCPAPVPDQVTGFSVFHTEKRDHESFVQELRPLIAATRNEPGNVEYRMFTHLTDKSLIGFVESFKNMSALRAHLGMEHVTSIFQHPYYLDLKTKGADLFGPWQEVHPVGCGDKQNDELEMAFYWKVNCTSKHVWDIITNWSDASWAMGKPKTTILPVDDKGNVMSEEEAEKLQPIDPKGGLAQVVQRRTWSDGRFVDIRMISRDDNSFVTVQETVSPLVFPNVAFDKFFVTLSLSNDGLDADIETRVRYHVRATMKKGSLEEGRQTLKGDFYGPRIQFYQESWNCSAAVEQKRAEKAIPVLYSKLEGSDRVEAITPLFGSKKAADAYFSRSFGDEKLPEDAKVEITNPFALFALPDLRVVAVEDIVVRSLQGTSVRPRIVIYQLDDWGRIQSHRVYDTPAAGCAQGVPKSNNGGGWWARLASAVSVQGACIGAEFIEATNRYYETLTTGDIEKVRAHLAEGVELHEPVGFVPKRTIDSVYNNFYTAADWFRYTRYPSRTFVDPKTRQTAQVVDAEFKLAGGRGDLRSHPVQVITFDRSLKISKVEAFFKPQLAMTAFPVN